MELVWPGVVCVVAVLAFLRLRPTAPPVTQKRVRQLEKKMKALEKKRDELLADMATREKAHRDELMLIKEQASERLNAFAADMTLLKQEFSTIKNKAGLKAVVERTG